jgi:hypothetical protein
MMNKLFVLTALLGLMVFSAVGVLAQATNSTTQEVHVNLVLPSVPPVVGLTVSPTTLNFDDIVLAGQQNIDTTSTPKEVTINTFGTTTGTDGFSTVNVEIAITTETGTFFAELLQFEPDSTTGFQPISYFNGANATPISIDAGSSKVVKAALKGPFGSYTSPASMDATLTYTATGVAPTI